jgi:hypothetical protein
MNTSSLYRFFVASLLLAAIMPAANAEPWPQSAIYAIIPNVELKVASRCTSPSRAEVMIGGLSTQGDRSTASDDPGYHPPTTPGYIVKTNDNQLFTLPVLQKDTSLMLEGVPSGSIVFSVAAKCAEAIGGPPGSFFGVYADPQAKRRVYAYP